MFDVEGKRILVTGASSGLGAAMAEGLAERGAIVGLCGITVFLYVEEPIARFVVLVTAVVSGGAWIWRKVAGDR